MYCLSKWKTWANESILDRCAGGWNCPNTWTNNCQLQEDNIRKLDFSDHAMIKHSIRFSPVSNAYRCMDHLFHNFFKTLCIYFNELTHNDVFDLHFNVSFGFL